MLHYIKATIFFFFLFCLVFFLFCVLLPTLFPYVCHGYFSRLLEPTKLAAILPKVENRCCIRTMLLVHIFIKLDKQYRSLSTTREPERGGEGGRHTETERERETNPPVLPVHPLSF